MSYFKRVIYNCKQATVLIGKKEIGPLTFREAIELRIHLFGCSFCRIYKKQSAAINAMVQELFQSSQNDVRLNDSFKEELSKLIEEELKKN